MVLVLVCAVSKCLAAAQEALVSKVLEHLSQRPAAALALAALNSTGHPAVAEGVLATLARHLLPLTTSPASLAWGADTVAAVLARSDLLCDETQVWDLF